MNHALYSQMEAGGLGAGEKADGGRSGGVLCESGRSCAGEEIAERISSPEI